MSSFGFDMLVTTAKTVAFVSTRFAIVALAAMAICFLIEKAEKRFPDRPLWRSFRAAALGIALIDLLILVLAHAIQSIAEVII